MLPQRLYTKLPPFRSENQLGKLRQIVLLQVLLTTKLTQTHLSVVELSQKLEAMTFLLAGSSLLDQERMLSPKAKQKPTLCLDQNQCLIPVILILGLDNTDPSRESQIKLVKASQLETLRDIT